MATERDEKLVRTLVGTALGAGGLAFSLTLVYLSMRAVMSIGGSCASGGPYVISRPCPRGTGWMMMVGIFGGMVSGLVMALTAGKGPKLWTLAWPALFISLGWNFIDFGLDPPEVTTTGGWIFCGVLFWLMGGLPLLALLRWGARSTFWGDAIDDGAVPGGAGGSGMPDLKVDARAMKDTLRALGPLLSKASIATRADSSTPPWVTTPAAAASVDQGMVDQLERLAAMHTAGDLSDEEYETAKRTLLGGDS